MLRISRTNSSEQDVVFHLEGKLIGPWVNELASRCTMARQEGCRISLDLTDVLFADRPGVALLRALRKGGVVLAGCSMLISEQLSRGP
jgi:hypothetical protein